ncbi:MAG: excinuclease ABC subunit A [Betaproteobacteria bacterium]|nr:excinuclease ABC subunit A [Betaproteobacteria bacterium]
MKQVPAPEAIAIRGARQNNLKDVSVDIPRNELVVVTGVSGSGKSSLAFDTLYAEGQRRYVETFSPYARQFLDRMDKPAVDNIDGVPPAIAIDQTNPVRTSRSTVGTMTELNDYLKLLFARNARLHCRQCSRPVVRDDVASIAADVTRRAAQAGDPRLVVSFPVTIPENFSRDEIRRLLEAQGYSRFLDGREGLFEVIQDRFRLSVAGSERLTDALESALRTGHGRVDVRPVPDSAAVDTGTAANAAAPAFTADPAPWRYSTDLHCPDCDIDYQDPLPSLFSFNSPLGACSECRGFGRVIDIDFGLVVPDETKSLRNGAIKPWQTPSFRECQDDLEKFAPQRGISMETPWKDLPPDQRDWILEGDQGWKDWTRSWPGTWYGVRRFFAWLETKSYKMHIRVLLSKYRAYRECPACRGARLNHTALLWRIGTVHDAETTVPRRDRFLPPGVDWTRDDLESLAGLCIHDVMRLPLDRLHVFVEGLARATPGSVPIGDDAFDLVMGEIRTRTGYLNQVGLGYLNLDRQSRTLSGGEVQRINLTTALGTSLVNTLFVLDEPTIGLHPRDVGRLISVMQRLRDAGNSLVVVEHEPQVMLSADRILEMGPGPGALGGRVVFFGTQEEFRRRASNPESMTAAYLFGAKRAGEGLARRATDAGTPSITLRGVQENNLQDIDVRFPLERLVCVTGVSGSGKSTLVQNVLYRALLRAKGRPTEAPGAFRDLTGHELIRDVVMVDQAPIGKTSRSNPASYVGAFDAIRRIFAGTPVARERNYTAGTFSFNSGDGRCATCGGSGFEHVEMQFLSDVYLRCPDCDGTRFKNEILEVRVSGRNIASVLEMTVSEALEFFRDAEDLTSRLRPLVDVGLDYLRLGQPVPTLSGGEAQRLKLAGELAKTYAGKVEATLFLFDEPTTGLHFSDTEKLLGAFRNLVSAGHSVVVIEHNLDVIRACDWIIDLGPEGGTLGGRVVAAGMVADILLARDSHTGAALREPSTGAHLQEPGVREDAPTHARYHPRDSYTRAIRIRNAREHNLVNVSTEIPHGKFTVVTGVSGSGKSTLAFDVVFSEGQRRYLESLNAYARQFVQPASRPDVDSIVGLPPTVAIEQRTSRGGQKSTVATLTEIYHFIRLLYVKLGVQHCPLDGSAIEPQSPEALLARLTDAYHGQHIGILAPLIHSRKGVYTDLAAWAKRKGHDYLRVDGEFVPTEPWPRLERFKEHTIELPVADVIVDAGAREALRTAVDAALALGGGLVNVVAPLDGLMKGEARVHEQSFSTRRACPACGQNFPELDPRLFSFHSKHGWCEHCFGTGLTIDGFDEVQTGDEPEWVEGTPREQVQCTFCQGTRLNSVARNVLLRGVPITEMVSWPAGQVRQFVSTIEFTSREMEIVRDALSELTHRLAFLEDVGLGYLSLDRSAPTLSGGEAQRIRLAAQLGSSLQGVCYVLDEPTIGLHPRDNGVLLDTLRRLQRKGNTLVVVEHDEDTIKQADHVLDLGPGAGKHGGHVVASGTMEDLLRSAESVTGEFLRQPLMHPRHARRPVDQGTPSVLIKGASLHNLKHIDARIPLQRLTVISGVSGSGKSTLARDILHRNLSAATSDGAKKSQPPELFGCAHIEGITAVSRVLEVDQTPIGKTPRSCPATYVGFWDSVRTVFASTTEARVRGYRASRFSFNTPEGRCPHCDGQGIRKIEMSFLPDVAVVCEICNGMRFDPATLAVAYRNKSIGDVLSMSADEAVEFFAAHPKIRKPLELLQDVGLGYLMLGQQSPTLSGGEAQRIKLVTELARGDLVGNSDGAPREASTGRHTLYILDEPTVGLHMSDVAKLIGVLHRLVDAGNTVVVVEHNLDVMAEADWIIDLGPEGGSEGGRIVAQDTPEGVSKASTRSHTGNVLLRFLRERQQPTRSASEQ